MTYDAIAASLVQQGEASGMTFHPANTELRTVHVRFSPQVKEVRSPTNQPDYLLHIERVVTLLSDRGARIAILARYLERQQRSATQGKRRSFLGRPTDDAA